MIEAFEFWQVLVISTSVVVLACALPSAIIDRLETASARRNEAARLAVRCQHGKRPLDCGACAFPEEAEHGGGGASPGSLAVKLQDVARNHPVAGEPRPWSLWLGDGISTIGAELLVTLRSGATHARTWIRVGVVADIPVGDGNRYLRQVVAIGAFMLEASTTLYVPIRGVHGIIRQILFSDKNGVEEATIQLNGYHVAQGTVSMLEEVYRR